MANKGSGMGKRVRASKRLRLVAEVKMEESKAKRAKKQAAALAAKLADTKRSKAKKVARKAKRSTKKVTKLVPRNLKNTLQKATEEDAVSRRLLSTVVASGLLDMLVMSYLPVKTMAMCLRVCTDWRQVTDGSDFFWRNLYHQYAHHPYFEDLLSLPPSEEETSVAPSSALVPSPSSASFLTPSSSSSSSSALLPSDRSSSSSSSSSSSASTSRCEAGSWKRRVVACFQSWIFFRHSRWARYDVAPTGRAHCWECNLPIEKGSLRLVLPVFVRQTPPLGHASCDIRFQSFQRRFDPKKRLNPWQVEKFAPKHEFPHGLLQSERRELMEWVVAGYSADSVPALLGPNGSVCVPKREKK